MEDLGLSSLPDKEFWSSQRVFLTGHTGFKGSWATMWLERLGARIFGYALPPDQRPNLYNQLAPVAGLVSSFGDVSDRAAVRSAAQVARPSVAIHMAAQSLVRRSYAQPTETFATNVMGAVHVLEALRDLPDLRAVLIVTTDKVYANSGDGRAFVESDALGGHDPYSASKAGAELVAASFNASFFRESRVPIATARAGNVIGGGDWSQDRIVPDVWRAMQEGRAVELRYPHATRPWQHVLDPLAGYLLYLEAMASDPIGSPGTLNFGPTSQAQEITVCELVELFGREFGLPGSWVRSDSAGPSEMETLALDARAAERSLGWRPRLAPREAVGWTADWYRRFSAGESGRELVRAQIEAYEGLP